MKNQAGAWSYAPLQEPFKKPLLIFLTFTKKAEFGGFFGAYKFQSQIILFLAIPPFKESIAS